MLSPELQAGLMLLGRSDKRWLLAKLSPRERSRLRSVFRSLNKGTVAPAAAVASSESPGPAATPVAGNADLRLLQTASAEELRTVVSGLPTSCIAVVLQSVQGSWSDEVMAGFETSRQVAIGACRQEIQSTPPSESFRRWLLQELAALIRQQRSQSATPARRFDALLDGAA